MLNLLIKNGQVIDGSGGIGESSNIPVAGAIAHGVGVRITDLPVTADKVLAGLKVKGAG